MRNGYNIQEERVKLCI